MRMSAIYSNNHMLSSCLNRCTIWNTINIFNLVKCKLQIPTDLYILYISYRSSSCMTSTNTIFSTRGSAAGTGAKEGIEIRCHDHTGHNKLHVHLKVSPIFRSQPQVSFEAPKNEWAHLTAVWTFNTTLKLYDNRQLDATGIMHSGSPFAYNANPLIVFGRRYTDGGSAADYSTASVDGVKIFNRPLSAAEVLVLYNSAENVN